MPKKKGWEDVPHDETPDWMKAGRKQSAKKLEGMKKVFIKLAKEEAERERKGKKTRIFFVSPVTSNSIISKKEKKEIEAYVKKLEKDGNNVFWPVRDNPFQEIDPGAMNILDFNFDHLLGADEVHIWYVPDSRGINADVGVTYFVIRTLKLKKKIIFVNSEDFPNKIKGKSFIKVLRTLQKKTAKY